VSRAVAVVHLRGEVSDARHTKVLDALCGLLPRVGVEGRGTFACDLRGTGRLLGPPERVGARIVAVLERVRIPAAVGIAERPFTARVLAERTATGQVARLDPGQERAFLAVLPLATLPLDEEHREELALLGIRDVGGFAELDRGAVLDRFGRAAAAAHALARGEDASEVRGIPPRRKIVAKRAWDEAIVDRDRLLFALKSTLDGLAAELAADGLAAMRLDARLEREGAPVLRVERLVLPPTADAAALLRSVRWAIEERPGREELGHVTGARVEVTEVEPARGRQIGLFAADGAKEEEAVAVARYLRSRLGAGAVLRADVADPGARVAEREAEWEEAVS
jgi:nucleotidyltransferase/DNA polymerase involved in DNA repair